MPKSSNTTLESGHYANSHWGWDVWQHSIQVIGGKCTEFFEDLHSWTALLPKKIHYISIIQKEDVKKWLKTWRSFKISCFPKHRHRFFCRAFFVGSPSVAPDTRPRSGGMEVGREAAVRPPVGALVSKRWKHWDEWTWNQSFGDWQPFFSFIRCLGLYSNTW